MALKLRSADLLATIQSGSLRPGEVRQAYNAIDSAITLRVHSRLSTILAQQNTPHARTSYSFVRAMQGPAMAMMTRGIAVQMKVRQEETERYVAIRAKAQALLDRLADAVWGPEEYEEVVKTKEVWTPIGKRGQPLTPRERTVTTRTTRTRPRGLNPGSAKQCLAFFNTALNMPIMYEIRKGPEGTTRTPTANDKALAKWAKRNTKGPGIDVRDRAVAPIRLAAPFVSLILTIRDADKCLAVLRTPIDPDGRMRCSYNVAATENWRWSSSKNVYGRGSNIQNITADLRRMFCADDGYHFVSTDLEQAESYVVAGKVWETTGDRAYLDAILSGDLHTQVCVMAWPELDWSDDPKANRKIADQRYPSISMSYRDVAKRIGHGCVTPDHEVLTKDGWVPITDCPPNILCMDSERNSLWSDVQQWNIHDFTGNMIQLKGSAIDQLVTPNHRIIFSKDPGGSGKLTEATADTWKGNGAIPLGERYVGGSVDISEEEAQLVAAVQADGHIRSNGFVRFHFHKQRKFDRLELLCQWLGIPFERKSDYVELQWKMRFPKQAGPWLLDWPYNALIAYSDEHRHWDGHRGETAISIAAKDRTHLEWIQTINRLIGKGGNISKPRISGFGTTMFSLQENNRRWAHGGNMVLMEVPYSGKVLCPTVPSGMFFVRRNGKISVTGNSNYRGSAHGISQAVGIEYDIVADFQGRYYGAFPAILQWHDWVRAQLMEHQYLDTPLGQRRWFFGRPQEDSTLREAIACVPQGTVASLLNLILWRCWARSLLGDPFNLNAPFLPIELLLQNHDAFAFQTPLTADLPTVIAAVNHEFQSAPLTFRRDSETLTITIPGEFVTGFNWGYANPRAYKDGNPDGLVKWGGSDTRTRRQSARTLPGDWLTRSA